MAGQLMTLIWFDVATLRWSKVYNGHPDLVGQEGGQTAATYGMMAIYCGQHGRACSVTDDTTWLAPHAGAIH